MLYHGMSIALARPTSTNWGLVRPPTPTGNKPGRKSKRNGKTKQHRVRIWRHYVFSIDALPVYNRDTQLRSARAVLHDKKHRDQ